MDFGQRDEEPSSTSNDHSRATSWLAESSRSVHGRGTELNADESKLAALGYKQEFRRHFGLWTVFCVSFSCLGLLPSVATTLRYGMGYAGTAGMTWGWLISMIGIQCVALSMAELASSMPTSGGLYYAASVLAPEGWGPFCAWIVGWSNWLSQVMAAPSIDNGCASMILAIATVYNVEYVPRDWHLFLLTACLLIIHACISSLPTRFIARLNSFSTWINLLMLAIFLIYVPAAVANSGRAFRPSAEVWGAITNSTGWPDGVAVLMSFISIIWTMAGYDAPFHLSEECSNASMAAPRAIVMTASVGGILGWFMMLVIAYTVVDISAALDSEMGQPFVAYLLQCLSQRSAVALASMTVIASFLMGQASMVAASRVTYAYGRDGVFPFSGRRFGPARVNAITKTPVNAVWTNTIFGVLMNLLIFGGAVTIGAIFSIGAISAFIAFTLPTALRTFVVGRRFRAGPWSLGRWSRISGVIATGFTLLMAPILCFPPAPSGLTAQTMNYTVVVYGAPMSLALVWWLLSARHWFTGPKVNLEHQMHISPGLHSTKACSLAREKRPTSGSP